MDSVDEINDAISKSKSQFQCTLIRQITEKDNRIFPRYIDKPPPPGGCAGGQGAWAKNDSLAYPLHWLCFPNAFENISQPWSIRHEAGMHSRKTAIQFTDRAWLHRCMCSIYNIQNRLWIQVGNWRGGWGWPSVQSTVVLESLNPESGLNVTDCVAEITCVAHGGRLPQIIEGCSITTATTDGF